MSKAFGKALSISLLNQIVSSGTNFLIVLYLVRVMEKSAFGTYSFAYALTLILSGLISSSVSEQYVVNVPDQCPDAKANYAVHHAILVMVLGIALLLVSVLVMAIPATLEGSMASMKAIAMVVATVAATHSLRDFLVRVAYSAKREDLVLYSSLTISVVVLLCYFLLGQTGVPNITAADGLLVLAASYGAGVAVLAVFLRLPLANSTWHGVQMAFCESWRGGKWNAVTNVVYSIRTQAHNFIVGPLLGMTALAEVNAARVLVTPAIMAVPPLSQLIMPRLAEKRAQGAHVGGHQSMLIVALFSGLAVAYGIVLVISLPWIVPLALGEVYEDAGTLVISWCLVAIVLTARNGLTIVLQVTKRFRGLMLVNIIAAAVAVGLAALLSWSIGAVGAVMALGLSELVLCILLANLLRAPRSAPQ